MTALKDPTAFYLRCFHYFHTRLPEPLREHRAYFETGGRGFGEKAFHVMWFLLFREFSPESFLEIGVFRGQILSLAALLARHFHLDCFMQGISPFSPAGDAVSKYRRDVDYYDDTLKNFAHFSLPAPGLVEGLFHRRSGAASWSRHGTGRSSTLTATTITKLRGRIGICAPHTCSRAD